MRVSVQHTEAHDLNEQGYIPEQSAVLQAVNARRGSLRSKALWVLAATIGLSVGGYFLGKERLNSARNWVAEFISTNERFENIQQQAREIEQAQIHNPAVNPGVDILKITDTGAEIRLYRSLLNQNTERMSIEEKWKPYIERLFPGKVDRVRVKYVNYGFIVRKNSEGDDMPVVDALVTFEILEEKSVVLPINPIGGALNVPVLQSKEPPELVYDYSLHVKPEEVQELQGSALGAMRIAQKNFANHEDPARSETQPPNNPSSDPAPAGPVRMPLLPKFGN